MPTRHHAERVSLTENVEKILAALSFLLTVSDEKGKKLTQYDLVKSLFLADRTHLNKWGRPITFDNYVAMKHGPVPSLSYNFLKEDLGTMRRLEIKNFPWTREKGDQGKFYFSNPTNIDFEETLTESDIEALSTAVNLVLGLGFAQIRRLTHEDVAYIDAWDDESDAAAFPMSLALFFDNPDFDTARELSEYSPYR